MLLVGFYPGISYYISVNKEVIKILGPVTTSTQHYLRRSQSLLTPPALSLKYTMEGYMLPGWMRGHRIIQLGSGDLALRDDAPGELWLGKLLGFSLSFTREVRGIVSAVPFLLKNNSDKVC